MRKKGYLLSYIRRIFLGEKNGNKDNAKALGETRCEKNPTLTISELLIIENNFCRLSKEKWFK
ncbi:MAG: hypothetical protein PHW62_02655 [Candidatus Ratteibacteria bacterium]|nr:hypothetical protein [Candidatus Ratteibacteria bacterium]